MTSLLLFNFYSTNIFYASIFLFFFIFKQTVHLFLQRHYANMHMSRFVIYINSDIILAINTTFLRVI